MITVWKSSASILLWREWIDYSAARREALVLLTLSVLAIGLFAVAAVGDIASRRIPNRLVLALAALGLVRIGMSLHAGAGVASVGLDLAVAGAVLALGALAFQLRLFGGGDVKLLAAGALWVGAQETAPFLTITALAGGVLAIIFLIWTLVGKATDRTVRARLPYGVAIALGGIVATVTAL